MKKRKKLLAIVIIVFGYAIWCRTYTFNIEKATKHLTENANDKSIHCCAWYVMRALQAGGCPAIILPAQWYGYFMPLVQFEEVSKANYVPQAGDVVVFDRPAGRDWNKISQWWGHIAMYNGHQWVSDFSQRHMNPYKTKVPYQIFRYRN